LQARLRPLAEESILNLCEFRRTRAFLVIVRHVVDPSAHGIAPHTLGIAGLQQIGNGFDLCHARIKPEVVAIRVEDDWHSVVDACGHGIRGRGEDRAGLDPVAIGVFPTILQPRKREQLPLIYLKAKWLLGFPVSLPLVKAVRRNHAPAQFQRIAERRFGARRF
jgi:hypothetical protein